MKRSRRIEKAPTDFERSMLPQTRREVFWDVVKMQWKKLLLLALILLITALPLLLIAVYEDTYILTVQEDPAIDQSSIPGLIAPLHILCAVLSAPCLVLFFLSLAGAARVLRQLAWGENVMLFQDLMIGLRQNRNQFLPTGLLFGLCYTAAKIGWHSALAAASSAVWVPGLILGLLIVFVAPVTACCVAVIPVYSNRFADNLRLSVFIYLKNPLKTVGFMLLAFGLCTAVWVTPALPLHLIGSIPAMLLFVLGLLRWMLFLFDQLDAHYNASAYPELVGKGLNGK